MEYTRQLEASTIVAKPIVPVKIVSLNVKPGVTELQLAPAAAVRPAKPRKKTSKNEPDGPWHPTEAENRGPLAGSRNDLILVDKCK
jgi:hypothetical protein